MGKVDSIEQIFEFPPPPGVRLDGYIQASIVKSPVPKSNPALFSMVKYPVLPSK